MRLLELKLSLGLMKLAAIELARPMEMLDQGSRPVLCEEESALSHRILKNVLCNIERTSSGSSWHRS